MDKCLDWCLQAFAGMKLDATLASINLEARHDGVLAERLAHWRSVFREKGRNAVAAVPRLAIFASALHTSLNLQGVNAAHR
jgi:hypothetical protein